jgi:glycosyltransferase involved in cell wall biosynthesis
MIRQKIYVIIPAFNEESCLPLVLAALPQSGYSFERVIVADNASDDSTAELAVSAGATVVYEENRGYGSACLKGIEYLRENEAISDTDIVVFIDGDFSDYPEDMPTILEPLIKGGADFVVGSRLALVEHRNAVPPVARIGNAFAMLVLRLRHGVRFSDMGPFRAITWEALEWIGMRDKTWGWTLEMQWKAARDGLRCLEVPVRYRERHSGKSKISQSFSGAIKAGSKILWVLGLFLLRDMFVSRRARFLRSSLLEKKDVRRALS